MNSLYKEPSEIPSAVKNDLDAIIVLGGGVPESVNDPPIYTKARCQAAAQVYQSLAIHGNGTNNRKPPKILALSAGTAHLPQLLSADGLPIWESTASASYLMNELQVPAEDLYVETTSYDTISNAFFTRTNFCDIADWKNLLIVTNEFHMKRTRYIFEWIMNAENPHEKQSSRKYNLSFLSVPDVGLSEVALKARYDREEQSAHNVKEVLSKNYPSLPDIFDFLNHNHSFYSAKKLVDRANLQQHQDETPNMMMLRQSYGGLSSEGKSSSHRRITRNWGMKTEFLRGVICGVVLVGLANLLFVKRKKIHVK